MRFVLVIGAVGALGLSLAGCQTAEQSMSNAQNVCMESGLRPGTRAYARCTDANYRNNVAQSNAAANQVAAGAAVAAIGGAAIAASASHPYYYCRGWGCWYASDRGAALHLPSARSIQCSQKASRLGGLFGYCRGELLRNRPIASASMHSLRIAMKRPVIILVEPQLAENIGMVARAMANFGLSELRLVAPAQRLAQEGRPFGGIRRDACARGAPSSIASAREAIADLHYVFATTARERGQMKRVFAPEPAMAEAQGRLAEGQGVGILFGRERTGLENDEVSLADAIITFPVDPKFSSLNLAQAVLLVAYEWYKLATGGALPFSGERRSPPAPRDKVLSFFDYHRERARGGELLPAGQAADHDPQHAGHFSPSGDDRAGCPHAARRDSRPCRRAAG